MSSRGNDTSKSCWVVTWGPERDWLISAITSYFVQCWNPAVVTNIGEVISILDAIKPPNGWTIASNKIADAPCLSSVIGLLFFKSNTHHNRRADRYQVGVLRPRVYSADVPCGGNSHCSRITVQGSLIRPCPGQGRCVQGAFLPCGGANIRARDFISTYLRNSTFLLAANIANRHDKHLTISARRTLLCAAPRYDSALMETRTASIVQGSALEPDRTKHGM